MDLFENEELIKKNKKIKMIMIIIVVLILILIAICGVLVYLINEQQKNTLKLNIDGKSSKFASDVFVIENGKVYVGIRAFGELMGYESHNADYKNRYSEDTTNCYINNLDEIASYSLNSNTIYKKATKNEDYEYFDIEEPVKLINDKLYTTIEGIQIGTNCMMQFNTNNNQITVYSLDYIVSNYSSNFTNSVIVDDKSDFNNKKALRYDRVVVMNENKLYGVVDSNGKEIIGTKYSSISFKEDSKEFTVTTEDGKMGILSIDGSTKIMPNYDEIKQISRNLNYYLVSNNKKRGVINQNGNIVIHLEYDKIGIDETKFSSNYIESPYILYDNCIPVEQNKKWGIFDISGKLIIPVEFDEIGCITSTQSNSLNNNVLLIPQYEGIVLGKSKKYKIINSLGKDYVPLALDSVYSVTNAGEDTYYMTFTVQEEQDGKKVDKIETYNVDDYFAQILHISNKPTDENKINTNVLAEENTNQTVNNETENQTNIQENSQTQNIQQ